MSSFESQPAAPDPLRRAKIVATAGAAVIGLVFSAFVGWRMLDAHGRMTASNPETAPDLLAIRQQIGANPDDLALPKAFRSRDLELRTEFLRAQYVLTSGTPLLVGGLAVALAGAVAAIGCYVSAPTLGQAVDGRVVDRRSSAIGRFAALGLVGALVGLAVALVVLSDPATKLIPLPPPPPPPDLDALLPRVIPKPEDIARYWNRFRGPQGAATSAYTNIPQEWDGASGKNVRWRTPTPLEGKNSPILWDKRLFLAAADKRQRLVLAYDTDTGAELWRTKIVVPGPPSPAPEVDGDTGYAPCTMVTDGEYVVAMFPNGDLAGLDVRGKLLWAKNLGLPDNGYGHGSSLATWEDKTLVLFDQGGLDDGKSSLRSFTSRSGKLVWARPRPVASSWATPIVINVAGVEQIITSADPWVIAYAPKDGKEIWRAECMSGDVASSPVYADGRVFVVHENADLVAIRPDGHGNVTKTHIDWKAEDGLPDITSPVSNGKHLWMLTTSGDLTCYDVKTGKLAYLKELDESFYASPSIVGDTVWLMSMKGTTLIIDDGPEFKKLHKSQVGEKVFVEDWVTVLNDFRFRICVPTADGKSNSFLDELIRPNRRNTDPAGKYGAGESVLFTAFLPSVFVPRSEKVYASPVFADGRVYIRGEKHLYCIEAK